MSVSNGPSREVINAILRSSFRAFAAGAFQAIEDKAMRRGEHVNLICEAMQGTREGPSRRLVINQPPRTLKSFLGTAFAAWILGHEPGKQVIIASHEDRLAQTLSDRVRQIMRTDFYQAAFSTRVRADFDRRDHFMTTAGGQVLAMPMAGGVTGHGADLLIVDDPIDAGKVGSQTERDQVSQQFEGKLLSRLNNKAEAIVLVLQQRLHPADLSGFLAERGGFEHLVIPLIAEEPQAYVVGDYLWPRAAGHVLDAEAFPPSVIEDLQRNPAMFAAQYQQAPRPQGEALVRPEWFGVYTTVPSGIERCVISIDTAMKSTGGSYSVALVFKTNGKDHFLVDVWRDRVDFEPLKAKAIELTQRYKPAMVVLEDAAFGGALQGSLEPLAPGKINMVKPRGSKLERLQRVIDILSDRHVHLEAWSSFKQAFVEEVCAFPGSATDDQVDALTQFLEVMREAGPAWGTPKFLATGPMPHARHPQRDPRNIHPNFIPRGRMTFPTRPRR